MKCFFCKKEITEVRFDIHHKDGNHSNDVPSNRVHAHKRCHDMHHASQRRGVPRSAETRAKISAANRGKPKSEEHRAKISASVSKAMLGKPSGFKGKTHTSESKAKISASLKRYNSATRGDQVK